jgi:cobalt-zinc-cadmium efflux system outer membrane protein
MRGSDINIDLGSKSCLSDADVANHGWLSCKDMIGKAHISMLTLLIAGCTAQSPYDRSYVSKGIKERTDYELGQVAEPGQFNVPEGVSLEDGLSQDEAVAIALWNNAQFQADLTALGFARADLVEANMLANPVFSLLFPVGPKLLETKLNLPIDVLWQRPHRIAAAQLDAQSLSENLVEHGLGLIRDVQRTYADLWLAQERVHLAERDAQLRSQIADLAQKRLRAGDISELAASAAYVDSLRATDASKRLSKESTILRQRLNALLGLTSDDMTFDIIPPDTTSTSVASVDELLETAFAARPDLRAAELHIEAAGERIGWEKSKVYNLIAIIDGKDKGREALTVGPGFAIEVPIFNQNNGKITRAKAELAQATQQYQAVRQNIILQVQEAHTGYVSAREAFELWSNDIIPSLAKKRERTQKSFEVGQVSYPALLEAERELVEARMRQIESTTHLHHSAAELNYSVGKKII